MERNDVMDVSLILRPAHLTRRLFRQVRFLDRRPMRGPTFVRLCQSQKSQYMAEHHYVQNKESIEAVVRQKLIHRRLERYLFRLI